MRLLELPLSASAEELIKFSRPRVCEWCEFAGEVAVREG